MVDTTWDERIGPFFTAPTTSALLQTPALEKLTARREVLGLLLGEGIYVYPIFQFTGRTPLPNLRVVLELIDPDDLDRWGDALWLQTPLVGGDATPTELLRTGHPADTTLVLAEALEAHKFWKD